MEDATPSINQKKKFFFASTIQTSANATREYFTKSNLFNVILISRFDGEFYDSADSSTYSHRRAAGMANYLGKALTTGCSDDSTCYVKTELMDMTILIWSNEPDFPFAKLPPK